MSRRIIKIIVSLLVRVWDLTLGRIFCAGKRTCVVLYYHSVPGDQRKQFAWQMDELLRRAKPAASDELEMVKTSGHHVAVTFDDGFISVVENALPELEHRRIPATIFVPSGCLGERPMWIVDPKHSSYHERVLSPEELRMIAKSPLIKIGSHSVSHPNFARLNSREALEQFASSKAKLENVLGRSVEEFSFPYGSYNERLLSEARSAGYRRIYTSNPALLDLRHPPAETGRISTDPDDWPLEFKLKVSGAYRWDAGVQKLKKKVKAWFAK